jgi:hypothetical protein
VAKCCWPEDQVPHILPVFRMSVTFQVVQWLSLMENGTQSNWSDWVDIELERL